MSDDEQMARVRALADRIGGKIGPGREPGHWVLHPRKTSGDLIGTSIRWGESMTLDDLETYLRGLVGDADDA